MIINIDECQKGEVRKRQVSRPVEVVGYIGTFQVCKMWMEGMMSIDHERKQGEGTTKDR